MPQPYNPWGTAIFPDNAAFGTGSPAEDAQRQPNMLDNILSHVAGALGRGFMAPGNALNSTTPITTEQMIKPAADIAGSMTLGAGAIPADINALRMGIKAYHGSPHDFDRFDISKIGTGEGAQAYGHGLYFAENEGVAKAYREGLSPGLTVQGQPYDARNPVHLTAQVLKSNGGDVAKTINAFGALLKYGGEREQVARQAMEMLRSGSALPSVQGTSGKMYEVNLNADPAHFLDWDKPIGQQASKVDEGVTDVLRRSGVSQTEANYIANNKTGQDVVRRISRPSFAVRDPGEAMFQPFGGPQTYEAALDAVGGDKSLVRSILTPDPVYTSKALNEAGIPGIRYLDQGSRQVDYHSMMEGDKFFAANADKVKQSGPFDSREAAWQWINAEKERLATRNYVMFDDKLIDILKKYGLAGFAAPPIFANAAGDNSK